MDLTPYVDGLRRDLAANAAAGGETVAKAGELLATALDPATRMRLLEALGDAATEVTTALDEAGLHHTEVQVHLQDRQAVFAVAIDPTAGDPHDPADAMDDMPTDDHDHMAADDTDAADTGATARITLRLPERLKTFVEQAAAEEGISVNSWLVRAVSSWASPQRGRGRGHHGPAGAWATGWYGYGGPGPGGHGPAGPGPGAPGPGGHGPGAPGPGWAGGGWAGPGWDGPWGPWAGGRPGRPGRPGRRGNRITGYSQT
jgi:hypothetical protein